MIIFGHLYISLWALNGTRFDRQDVNTSFTNSYKKHYLAPDSGFKRQTRRWAVGHIRLVTSRPLEVGLKPDKGRSAYFVLNKSIPFGPINRPTAMGAMGAI